MDFPLNQRQAELVGIARELGRDKFAGRAAKYDAEASFPFENYADLREVGFLRLTIPERHGGLGADYLTYVAVAAELGRWCGATALTFNMHTCTMMWTNQMADDLEMSADDCDEHERRRAGIYRMVVEDGALFAQPFSEPNTAAAAGKAPFGTSARKVDGGWRVSGTKYFASLSGAATHYGVLCTEAKPDADARDTIYLAVDGTADGFEITGPWDPVGMRATVSRTLKLDDVFVPDEHQMMPRGAYFRAAVDWPHMFMTLCPTYMGIAQAAFDFTVAYMRGEVPGIPAGARSSPAKQIAVAEMRIKLEQAKALFWRAVTDAGFKPSREARMRAYAAQFTVMEFANDIARLAIRVCGGKSIMKSLPLERLYRDSRCGALMLPWSADICLERLGRESLYQPGERD